jgi:hypothetical protein
MSRIGWIAFLVIAVVATAATVLIAGSTSHHEEALAARPVAKPRTPSAPEFGRIFVGTTNQFAAAKGDPKRISRPDCVQASPGAYMCSYVVRRRPGAPRACFLMQARWTPKKESTITVTLAGRTGRCGSLQAALDSLE